MKLSKILRYLGFNTRELNFCPNIAKRLDEHRELAESILENTDLFQTKKWHIGHMADQDDFLLRIFFIVHREWPDSIKWRGGVRPRPQIFGPCGLTEYPQLGSTTSCSS